VEVLGVARGRSAVRLRLETGRKHQIRVHAALAGAPVLGDRRYGDEAARAFPRLALHASELALAHPTTGERLTVTAPTPPDLPAWIHR
jgi:23S rRNA-/tRNA-specific pseudouridylate synthase